MTPENLNRLLVVIRSQYRLRWDGIHGIDHWRRVSQIGNALAEKTGADAKVVEAFAYLHDARRTNDRSDPGHGRRGAALAQRLNHDYLYLDDGQLELLKKACAYHTRGMIAYEPTIGTCWDADRLDLARFGIVPDKSLLSTKEARDEAFVGWASGLSVDRGVT